MSEPRDANHDRRLDSHGFISHGQDIVVTLDGHEVTSHRGETVAAALMSRALRTFRYARRFGEPRGLFCGIGLCYECLVVVDGRPNQRACMTYLSEGMKIEIQQERIAGRRD